MASTLIERRYKASIGGKDDWFLFACGWVWNRAVSGMDHHVYFWLKDECKGAADRAAFEQGLASLFEIGLVKGGRWAVPAAVMPRPVIDQSWDYAVTMQFENVADQDAYQADPHHQLFIDNHKDRWARVLVMDLA